MKEKKGVEGGEAGYLEFLGEMSKGVGDGGGNPEGRLKDLIQRGMRILLQYPSGCCFI